MEYLCKVAEVITDKEITIQDKNYLLVNDNNKIKLFSLICPHMGGTCEKHGDALVCPIHKWKFSATTGESLVGSKGLKEIELTIKDDEIFVDLSTQEIEPKVSKNPNLDVRVSHHSHACLEINYKDFTLLIDPWIDGPAFNGGWTHYPEPLTRAEDISPDVILLTHEHSDHFHPNTLRHYPKDIPIFYPAFPNKRMDKMLKELGYTDLRPMIFGHAYKMYENVVITTYEPTGNWNDAMQLIDVDGWRMLNLNDAGINHRIAREAMPVDLICSSFRSGASGFPLCWTHFTQEKSDELLASQFEAKTEMLRHASKLYRCRNILLFASYFALWHPDKRAYQKKLSEFETSPKVMKDKLSEFKINVLDVLPGDSWSNKDKSFTRGAHHDNPALFEWEYMSNYLDKKFDQSVFENFYPSGYDYNNELVEQYFLHFKYIPEIRKVGEYRFNIIAEIEGGDKTHGFHIKDGNIYSVDPTAPTNLDIRLPSELLMYLIAHNISWDEIYIGYWCTFENEKPYNVAFWRMLQAPYYMKTSKPELTTASYSKVNPNAAIGDILEDYGNHAARIIARYGMYCTACERNTMETLHEGAEKHGLDAPDFEDMMKDLNLLALSQQEHV